MYFLRLYCKNAKKNRTGKFEIEPNNGSIPKWTILSSGSPDPETLRLIALSVAGPRSASPLGSLLEPLFHTPSAPLHLEFVLYFHPETEGKCKYRHRRLGSGFRIFPDGTHHPIPGKKSEFLPPGGNYRKISHSINPAIRFMLAYGPRFTAHQGTDDFDFTSPHFIATRFHSLFHPYAKLTDPEAFLRMLRYKGARCKKRTALSILTKLSELLEHHLGIDSRRFPDRSQDVGRTWRELPPDQRRMILPLMDMARHLYDAFRATKDPFDMPGVVLLHRPDLFCTAGRFSAWIKLVDALLPNMQFIMTLSDQAGGEVPAAIQSGRLALPKPEPPTSKNKRPPHMPKKSVLLLDVDSRLPNLALMKLSRYYKERGKKVVLAKKRAFLPGAGEVFASCIFNSESSRGHVRALKKYYGPDLQIGGSGVNLQLRLPPEIEAMEADYDLYPELKDRAIGFITRGCPCNCPFCVVPLKEGTPRKVNNLSSLLGKNRKKLILLDDNLLAYEDAPAILAEMADRDIRVNFTQTLDIRFVTREKADLLRRINCMNTRFTRPNFHFSLNDNKGLSLIASKYDLFGFTNQDNVEFICMYGFNTTLAQDVERFRFLRSLPGAYVFVQKYQPIGKGKTPPPLQTPFFDENADKWIDELITLVFTQNMKSMETYYRWISRKYALKFGKLHQGLVDTIFRYNERFRRGEYVATLAGTRK
jgi:hypothetical protein